LARKIQEESGDEFLAFCGNRPLPGGISALCFGQQILENPNLHRKVRHYLHANGWIGFLLTGARFFDFANASFTGLFDTLHSRQWSPRWCQRFGVELDWLPDVGCGSTTIGTLQSITAKEWGIPEGIPVKIGTADTSSGMMAAGMTKDDLFITVGTTTVLARFVSQPHPDPRRLTRMFGIGDSVIYAAHNPVGGSALPWIMDLCFGEYQTVDRINEFYQQVIPQAATLRTNVRLDPPYLGGDRLEIEARRAAFGELTLSTNRMDLLAALLAAMREGYRQAHVALDWESQPEKRIFLTGGGSEILRAIIPELANRKIELIEEGALRGVARLFDSHLTTPL
jgi:xylulokinase